MSDMANRYESLESFDSQLRRPPPIIRNVEAAQAVQRAIYKESLSRGHSVEALNVNVEEDDYSNR